MIVNHSLKSSGPGLENSVHIPWSLQSCLRWCSYHSHCGSKHSLLLLPRFLCNYYMTSATQFVQWANCSLVVRSRYRAWRRCGQSPSHTSSHLPPRHTVRAAPYYSPCSPQPEDWWELEDKYPSLFALAMFFTISPSSSAGLNTSHH